MTIDDIKKEGLLLFECISGSMAYGLATPQSDVDMRGVFYLPNEKVYGLDYIPQISSESNDEVYYELGRFVGLLVKNNPNILELLAMPDDCVLYRHPVLDRLKLDMFLSKLCKVTFAGYAISQIHKARGLKKKIVNPIPKERQSVLDFCYIIQGYSTVSARHWLAKQDWCRSGADLQLCLMQKDFTPCFTIYLKSAIWLNNFFRCYEKKSNFVTKK